MNYNLQKAWTSLEEQKDLFEKEIRRASLPQQQFSQADESWNMLQVLAHLVAVEKTSFDFLIAKNYTNARPSKGVRHKLQSFLLKAMLQSPIRFKAPAIPALSPSREVEAEALFLQWKGVGEKGRVFLENFPEEKINFLIFRHPVVGWLTIEQTIKFLKEHIQHHQQQLRRIRTSKGYPA